MFRLKRSVPLSLKKLTLNTNNSTDWLIDIHPSLDPFQFSFLRKVLNRYKLFKRAAVPMFWMMWSTPVDFAAGAVSTVTSVFTPTRTYEYVLLEKSLEVTREEARSLEGKRAENSLRENTDYGRDNVFSTFIGVCYENVVTNVVGSDGVGEYELCVMGTFRRKGENVVIGMHGEWGDDGLSYSLVRPSEEEEKEGTMNVGVVDMVCGEYNMVVSVGEGNVVTFQTPLACDEQMMKVMDGELVEWKRRAEEEGLESVKKDVEGIIKEKRRRDNE